MIRVCPHSDAACPHGMGCTWSCATDAYGGTKRAIAVPPTNPVPEAEGGGERLSGLAKALTAVEAAEPGEPMLNALDGLARTVRSALSSEAPPVVCGGEDGSARASVAEPASPRRSTVVPDAVRAGGRDPLERCARCGARHIEHDLEPVGFTCPDREGVFYSPADRDASVLSPQGSDSAPATDEQNPSQERAAVVPAAEQAGGGEP